MFEKKLDHLQRRWLPLSSENGSVFIDILITLLIASTALLLILGGISMAGRTAAITKERILQIISTRNEDVATDWQFLAGICPGKARCVVKAGNNTCRRDGKIPEPVWPKL